MTIHGVVRTDKLHATNHGPIVSLQAPADTDNGSVFFAGDFVSGNRELRTAVTADANSIANLPLLLVAQDELTYLAGQVVTDFYNPSGKAMRCFQLAVGDIFTVTTNMLTGTAAVDSYVEPVAAATMLSVTGTLPTTRFIGKIIALETIAQGQNAAVIEVIHA